MTPEGLLAESRDDLLAFIKRNAGRLLRYETAEDLLQGVHLRALERGGDLEYRGREPFLSWLYAVTRTYLADRHAHWSALKRRPAALLRLTRGGSDPGAALDPAVDATGPATFAARREQLMLAVKALAFLDPRDRELVRWTAERVPVPEQAGRLGISYEACKSASRRALDRYRGLFERLGGG